MTQIELLKEIWEATKNIKSINEKLDDFDKRLKNMETQSNNIWTQEGIKFMNNHGHKVVGIVEIFNKKYGNSDKISGYNLIENVLNSFAKSKERKKLFFISVINSLAFRFVEIICIILLFLLYLLKGKIIGK